MEYEDAVKIIEDSESAETQVSIEINVGSIFESKLNEAEYDYNKADAKINYVESRGIVGILSQQQYVHREAKPEKEKVVKEGPHFGKELETAAEDVKHLVSRIGKKEAKPVQEIIPKKPEVQKRTGRLEQKIQKAAKKTEVVQAPEEKLVLPSLSLQDQLSDLEGISDGLKEYMFGEEELSIMKAEVFGLEKIAKSEKAPSDPIQKNLFEARNNKLAEVIKILKEKNERSA